MRRDQGDDLTSQRLLHDQGRETVWGAVYGCNVAKGRAGIDTDAEVIILRYHMAVGVFRTDRAHDTYPAIRNLLHEYDVWSFGIDETEHRVCIVIAAVNVHEHHPDPASGLHAGVTLGDIPFRDRPHVDGRDCEHQQRPPPAAVDDERERK